MRHGTAAPGGPERPWRVAAVGTTCFPGHDPFSHAGTKYRAVVWLNGRLWDLAYLAGDL
ncbi:MAG: hypothetical protein ACM3PC_05945 [Deltaproteobacteria bacterium]